MDIELSGMTEMLAKINRLRTELPTTQMRKAVRAGANVIRDAMIEDAPVQTDRHGPNSSSLAKGELAEGIRTYMPANAEPIEAEIGPKRDVEHQARWVEYGHRMVTGGYSKITATGTRGPGSAKDEDVPAHPFLRAAFERSLPDAEAAMQASISKSIEDITK